MNGARKGQILGSDKTGNEFTTILQGLLCPGGLMLKQGTWVALSAAKTPREIDG